METYSIHLVKEAKNLSGNITIDELDLKVRSYIFLKKNDLFTLPDICKKLDEGIEELLKMPRVTEKVTINILRAVKACGYPSEKLVDEYLVKHRGDYNDKSELLALWDELQKYLQEFVPAEEI